MYPLSADLAPVARTNRERGLLTVQTSPQVCLHYINCWGRRRRSEMPRPGRSTFAPEPENQKWRCPCPTPLCFSAPRAISPTKRSSPHWQALIKQGAMDMPIIGIARAGWSLEKLQERARASVEDNGGVDEAAFRRLCSQMRYLDGDYTDSATYARLKQVLEGASRPLHYLAIPPSMFGTVVQGLGKAGCATHARVIVEKPFGRSLASARELNRTLHAVFPEESVFRIDHFLGKEAVQNLLYFRFANTFRKPIWNRNYIDNVQITMAESFGVQGRGHFYEEVGAIRDVVQNHLLQVISLLAMDCPVGRDSESMRAEKV